MTPSDDDFSELDAVDAAAVPDVTVRASAHSEAPERLRPFDTNRASAWIKEMAKRHEGPSRQVPVPWPKLSDMLAGEEPNARTYRKERAGLPPGMHVLVGNTGSGKSQFALSIMLAALKADVPALFVALELGTDDVFARLVALDAGTRWSDLAMGRRSISSAELKSAAELAEKRLYILEESPGRYSAHHLEVAIRNLRKAHQDGPALVIVDFLQLVGGDVDGEMRQHMSAVTYMARELARELSLSTLLLSSTARANYAALNGDEGESKKAKVPLGTGDAARFVGLGKESGDIEFASDSVVVLAKDPEDLPPAGDNGQPPKEGTRGPSLIHVALAKCRHGRTGWTRLKFNGHRFDELTKDDEDSIKPLSSPAPATAKPNGKPKRGAPVAERYTGEEE